ncbi:MAG TPA: glycosyltransferase family 39 protein, partial [Thermoanaerobaculia bacterium]|nr:glycosyltransferase family 39 protein [Thermoanaerobaculia bacterium]
MHSGEAIVDDDKAFRLYAGAGALLVALFRFVTIPRTFWEFDELLFAWGILDFDPRNHHPHPPGYPLVIGLGKAVNLVTGDPFNALVFLSFLSSVVGFVALAVCFRNITGEPRSAVLGSLLFALSPAMLVNGSLPMSDPPALLFLILAFMLASSFPEGATNRAALLFGVFCAASIGCRPQYAVSILPMFIFVIIRIGDWARARIALVSFTFTCLAWLSPLAGALGGVRELINYETRQAAYVAGHDASISRGARSAGDIVLRFVAHPWGPKWLALPVLFLAVIGAVRLARGKFVKAIPILIVMLVHMAFCFVSMDPADGVRYALPALIGVALMVSFSFSSLAEATQFEAAPAAFLALFVVGGFLYTREIILTRHRVSSPPLQAVAFARRNLPQRTILLYETALRPHAELLLGRFHPLPIDRGLQLYANRPDVPLYIFADGGSTASDVIRFSWPESDAYGKLTRDH